ncbi:MAG: hypothetical protein IJE12_09070 [Prevotella sp.]|nr:hypothetical protein [Prevotella sp.]
MNRLFTILCMASLLVFHTSCNEGLMDLESSGVELKTRAAEQKVLSLIQQARYGDAGAYNSLAQCYRDGDGVEKSYFNMLCMYANYCNITGSNLDKVVELFEDGHPFKKFTYLLKSSANDDEFMDSLESLEKEEPLEVKAIKAACDLRIEEKSATALNALRKAENEGSELAVLFQIVYYEEENMKADYEQCLIRHMEEYPFLNLKIGDLYAERHMESKDFSDIQKAIEYYYKADTYAMLTSKYAHKLINMYKKYGEDGLLNCDHQEMERLKKIASIND